METMIILSFIIAIELLLVLFVLRKISEQNKSYPIDNYAVDIGREMGEALINDSKT